MLDKGRLSFGQNSRTNFLDPNHLSIFRRQGPLPDSLSHQLEGIPNQSSTSRRLISWQGRPYEEASTAAEVPRRTEQTRKAADAAGYRARMLLHFRLHWSQRLHVSTTALGNEIRAREEISSNGVILHGKSIVFCAFGFNPMDIVSGIYFTSSALKAL